MATSDEAPSSALARTDELLNSTLWGSRGLSALVKLLFVPPVYVYEIDEERFRTPAGRLEDKDPLFMTCEAKSSSLNSLIVMVPS